MEDTAQQPPENGDLGLEARLTRLEEIIRSLEQEELELENALALFEEGVGHVRKAEEVLSRLSVYHPLRDQLRFTVTTRHIHESPISLWPFPRFTHLRHLPLTLPLLTYLLT